MRVEAQRFPLELGKKYLAQIRRELTTEAADRLAKIEIGIAKKRGYTASRSKPS